MIKDYYIVKPGDTLWSIAKKNNIDVNKLKNANNLTTNTLKVGQTLILPSDGMQNIENIEDIYIVKPGDTLYSIARKYNINIDELKKINNLTTNTLSIGQQLKIKNDIFEENEKYIVQKGDTLYGIAKKNNINPQELMEYNSLKSNLLSIGQIIKIPVVKKYIVKPGDTLYNIAISNQTTVDQIKQKNNLIDNTLSIGQELII